jgi:ankyrin repeat protein
METTASQGTGTDAATKKPALRLKGFEPGHVPESQRDRSLSGRYNTSDGRLDLGEDGTEMVDDDDDSEGYGSYDENGALSGKNVRTFRRRKPKKGLRLNIRQPGSEQVVDPITAALAKSARALPTDTSTVRRKSISRTLSANIDSNGSYTTRLSACPVCTLGAKTDADKLLQAAAQGHELCIRAIIGYLESGIGSEGVVAALEGSDVMGRTSLHFAVAFGHTGVLKILVGAGASPSRRDTQGQTPLHLACMYGHAAIAEELLLYAPDTVNCADLSEGDTPLHSAAFYGHEDIVRMLLDAGARATAKNQHGRTPLHSASTPACVQHLLENGASTETVDNFGYLPIHLAASLGHPEVLHFLMMCDETQTQVNAREPSYGFTPLHCAANYGHIDCIFALLKGGADPNAMDGEGRTPGAVAALAGFDRAAGLLMRSSAESTANQHAQYAQHQELYQHQHAYAQNGYAQQQYPTQQASYAYGYSNHQQQQAGYPGAAYQQHAYSLTEYHPGQPTAFHQEQPQQQMQMQSVPQYRNQHGPQSHSMEDFYSAGRGPGGDHTATLAPQPPRGPPPSSMVSPSRQAGPLASAAGSTIPNMSAGPSNGDIDALAILAEEGIDLSSFMPQESDSAVNMGKPSALVQAAENSSLDSAMHDHLHISSIAFTPASVQQTPLSKVSAVFPRDETDGSDEDDNSGDGNHASSMRASDLAKPRFRRRAPGSKALAAEEAKASDLDLPIEPDECDDSVYLEIDLGVNPSSKDGLYGVSSARWRYTKDGMRVVKIKESYFSMADAYKAQKPYRDAARGAKQMPCVLCKKNIVSQVFLPCEHACVCNACMKKCNIGASRTLRMLLRGGQKQKERARQKIQRLQAQAGENEEGFLGGPIDAAPGPRLPSDDEDEDDMIWDICPVCFGQILVTTPVGRLSDPVVDLAVSIGCSGGAPLPSAVFTAVFRRSATKLRAWVSRRQTTGKWEGSPTEDIMHRAGFDDPTLPSIDMYDDFDPQGADVAEQSDSDGW